MGILANMEKSKWAAENVCFGSGGALLQKVNRDTQKCAFKCCEIIVDGTPRPVYKDPITDPGKRSKQGRLKLVKQGNSITTLAEGKGDEKDDLLVEVFNNGVITESFDFTSVRSMAEKDLVAQIFDVKPEDLPPRPLGIYFEISDGPGHQDPEGRSFPNALGPFTIAGTSGIAPSALKVEWGPPNTWATEERRAILARADVCGPQTQALCEHLPEEILLSLSPLHPVNLSEGEREAAGIPSSAEHFVFVYPHCMDWDSLPSGVMVADDSDAALLSVGGFVYFDNNLSALKINALVKSDAGGLKFGPPKEWQAGWDESLQKQGRFFHPVTLKALSDQRATQVAWLSPNSVVGGKLGEGGKAICPHGGFAYLFS